MALWLFTDLFWLFPNRKQGTATLICPEVAFQSTSHGSWMQPRLPQSVGGPRGRSPIGGGFKGAKKTSSSKPPPFPLSFGGHGGQGLGPRTMNRNRYQGRRFSRTRSWRQPIINNEPIGVMYQLGRKAFMLVNCVLHHDTFR